MCVCNTDEQGVVMSVVVGVSDTGSVVTHFETLVNQQTRGQVTGLTLVACLYDDCHQFLRSLNIQTTHSLRRGVYSSPFLESGLAFIVCLTNRMPQICGSRTPI